MKSKTDPRHTKRRVIVKDLFAYSFAKQPVKRDTQEILKRITEIDAIIAKGAPDRPITEINKADLAILRLAVFELLEDKTPPKVVIDEAVELAKEFGAESAPSFVNGVLGAVVGKGKLKNDKN